MYLYKKIRVKLNERVVVFRNGLPLRALGPGRHLVWGSRLTEQRWETDALTFNALLEVRALLPDAWFAEVTIAEHQRGLLYRDGRPRAFLRPGVHRYWTVDPSVKLTLLSVDEPMPKLSDELVAVIPRSEYVYVVVREHERGLAYLQGRLARVLEPGRHAFLRKRNKLMTWNTNELAFWAPPEVLAALPPPWFTTITLAPTERAVIYRDDKPMKFLRPGVHRVWTVDPNVAVRTFAVTDPAPELTDELRAIIPTGELVEQQVKQFERGLLYVQGRFEGMLEPGKHAFWNHPGARVTFAVLDTRVQKLDIAGQELMTRDKVTLRLTLAAEYAPADAPTTVHAVADVKDALYLAVQLAAREYVAGVTLDELLEGREALTRYLEAQVQPRAEAFGLRLHRVGVKDVILPGEMKTLLNKVIEAEKAAAANVILRREDAAATRNMAQTAKVIAENPVLMRLKELETVRDVADKIDEVKLVLGGDQLVKLLTKD